MTQTALNWHPADILAKIAKKGSNLSRIAKDNGLSSTTPSKALREPCYSGEQAIAKFLDISAHVIWPNRYDSKGIPLHSRIRKQLNVETTIKSSQKRVAV